MAGTTKTNNNDNKSLFSYTALIFLVALVLIIIAFFGQSNVKRSQPDIPEATASVEPQTGITERASVLSEENRLLLEENDEIKNQLKLQTDEINRLNLEVQNLNKYKQTNDILMSANGYLSVENYDEARAALDRVDESALTEDQKILYNSIKENLE